MRYFILIIVLMLAMSAHAETLIQLPDGKIARNAEDNLVVGRDVPEGSTVATFTPGDDKDFSHYSFQDGALMYKDKTGELKQPPKSLEMRITELEARVATLEKATATK